MSDYIVLVKQVPDITQISDNAFNLETGTLIRSRLASVINELDTHALAIAHRMNQLSGKKGKIIALTMGPPAAEEVLRYCLARCCDSAVLLTDKALGGADTCATANPLAFAIKKIAKEMLGGSDDFYVVSGMQSVDGDTAQVPAQIAEELNMPCLPYVTDVEFKDGRFEFKGIISGGSQVITNKKVPAVITVAKYEYPLFATFAGTRLSNNFKFVQWGAADINATHIGINGSKTRVISVFPPGKTTRKCREVKDARELAKLMVENFSSAELTTGSSTELTTGSSANGKEKRAGESSHENYVLPDKRKNLFDRRFEGTKKETEDYKILSEILAKLEIKEINQITDAVKEKIVAAAGEHFHKKAFEDMLEGAKNFQPAYNGQVWVAAELDGDVIHPATFELIGKARELADSLETQVGVVIAGDRLATEATPNEIARSEHLTGQAPTTHSTGSGQAEKINLKQLIEAGADFVYAIEHPLLAEFDPIIYRKVVSDTIEKYWPQIILFAATPQGRIAAPMIAYRLGCGLTADCTGLDIRDSSRKNQVAILMQTRPALGGNVMATICTKDSKCQMATARPGVMKRLPADASRTGKVIREAADVSEADLSIDIIKTEKGKGKVNLGADVVVSGGKGMQSRDNYEALVNRLVESLKAKLGTSVEKGASRAAVEQGFIDRIHQVGQTGTAIGPKLYIALGISGAIQHMIGVANSDVIVAVNSDPNAPIFKHCDYYIVGTIEKIVPQIAEALAKI